MAPAYLIRFAFIINRHTDAKNNCEIFLKKKIFSRRLWARKITEKRVRSEPPSNFSHVINDVRLRTTRGAHVKENSMMSTFLHQVGPPLRLEPMVLFSKAKTSHFTRSSISNSGVLLFRHNTHSIDCDKILS